ncbi:hypothetical protein AB5J55_16670 [Streptomyces sp. R11]|uniref:Integral membrane protein n=1 Tax=Streptomyces sp. R11 TaxID=3238625 RepID=A0AB39MZG9_9ACTN
MSTMRGALRRPSVVAQVGAVLVVVLLVAVVVRLPWAGDLGMHAATVQRLRHDLVDPGNPLVDADTPSPYYSPWMLVLGCVARVTGFSVFVVLRIGAVVGLGLFISGVWRYVRTLSPHPAAPALSLLCLVFLWGTSLFTWSGFLGLNSLALTVSYPSVFALGLAFHLWAWLAGAVRGGSAAGAGWARGWGVWVGLGVLWAVILLCHQFSGVVASLGALATVVAARVRGGVWVRLGVGVLVGGWGFCGCGRTTTSSRCSGRGGDLEAVHRGLYRDWWGGTGWCRWGWWRSGCGWWRDRWDPLVLFFALGVVVVGGVG